MGVVVKQSVKNTIYTYMGFGIGAVNTLFLYTNFLSDEYYGLVGYILSASNILMPLLTFGVQNTLVKFYSSYKEDTEQGKFTFMMFILPLLLIVPVGILGTIAYESIVSFLARKNAIVGGYVWVIYITAIAMAYFEVFFAWTKVHMKSVYGNFLKEVFLRVVVMALLMAVFMSWLTPDEFIIGVMLAYILRMLLMMLSAFKVSKPKLVLALPQNSNKVIRYTSLIILAGSIAMVLLDVDKFMIGQYEAIENIAFYNVAVYIAAVIVVPARAMHQITYPLTARLLNERDMTALKDLYKRSSLNLFIIGGLILLLIVLNVNQLYQIIPDQYSGGISVVFFIAAAKLFECLLGNNNSILFNSDYYRMVLFFGVFLAILTVILNIIFIPMLGINGAALATLLAFLLYSIVKFWFVYAKLHIHPFTLKTAETAIVLLVFILVFYFWDFSFHPIINIVLKGAIVTVGYLLVVLKLKLSDDIIAMVERVLKSKARS
ncbi:lipopolysaccharide biosynthesis protein [Zhouia amylolytica]|uniref:lipopolysaccharide biosynthesis protein n=1 Tax=Zhouia amylolytica TaxID=376730 RepID=UPI0020CD1B25|nr:polysaccharide biosynthesis C-terminal domain-containing protein [Zhouia amylolytica]MCQ0112198.1 polysaccharide biosynthesis C-terminal domain-containing protein [Zhouia amylolytica]